MPLVDLDDRERDIVHRCLKVAADESAVFPEWEFATIFGLTRAEVAAIADRWPALDDSAEDVRAAINNSMNNMLGYTHRGTRTGPRTSISAQMNSSKFSRNGAGRGRRVTLTGSSRAMGLSLPYVARP